MENNKIVENLFCKRVSGGRKFVCALGGEHRHRAILNYGKIYGKNRMASKFTLFM